MEEKASMSQENDSSSVCQTSDIATPITPSDKSDETGTSENLSKSYLQGLKHLDWSWFRQKDTRQHIRNLNRSVRRLSDEGISSSLEFVRRFKHHSSRRASNDFEESSIFRDSEPMPSARWGKEELESNIYRAKPQSHVAPPRPPQPRIQQQTPIAIPEIKVTVHTQTPKKISPFSQGKKSSYFSFYGQPCPICEQQLQDFKQSFSLARSHKEKYQILTSVPETLVSDDNLSKEFSCTDLIAFGAAALRASNGTFSSPAPQFIQHIPEFVKMSISNFFDNPENGGEMKGKENCLQISGKKKIQKRAMFISLSQLYQEYIRLYSGSYRAITISRFSFVTPNHIVWSRKFRANGSYICLLHENLQLLLSACTTYYTEGIPRVLSSMVCSEESAHCMLGFCDKCPMERSSFSTLIQDYNWDEVIEFYFWQEQDVNPDSVIAMSLITEALPQFTTRLDTISKKFLKHHFIATLQKEYLKSLNSLLTTEPHFILVKINFCEPYTIVSKIGSKTASKLVNYDPQKTICVYPIVVKYFDKERNGLEVKNIVVISNDLRDNPTSAYLFQQELIKWVKQALPHVRHVIYFTNDNPKHYKNAEMILNLLYHEEDHNMKASLEFTVEGHDLNECCMLATQVKRECRLATLKGNAVIQCAADMFKYCRKGMGNLDLQFSFVDRFISRINNVELKLQRRYKLNSGIIPGISHFYSFQPNFTKDFLKQDTICLRRYSLSLNFTVVKVIMSSSSISSIDDFIFHSVTSYNHPYDDKKLTCGNVVTVNLEGKVFTAIITNDSEVKHGNLGVNLIGRINPGKGKKHIHLPLGDELPVWISTLDVLLINEDGEHLTKRRGSEGVRFGTKYEESRSGVRGWSSRSLSSSRLLSSIRKKDL